MKIVSSVTLAAIMALSIVPATAQTRRPAAKPPVKVKSAPVAVASAAPVAKPVAWHPTPFVNPTGNLPAGYTGESAWEVYQLLNGAAAKTKKDEFETTAQYEARMANPAALMGPLSVDAQYAFQITPTVAYDADSQSFKVGSEYGDECNEASYLSRGSGDLLCQVHAHRVDAADYEGQNAYGASATIKRIRGTDIYIAMPRASMPKSIFGKKSYGSDLRITHRIPVPLEQAAQFRGKKIALLAVGNITSPKLVEGRGVYSRPTIKDPYDMAIAAYGIPFAPKEYIFYVVETGQVLERIPA